MHVTPPRSSGALRISAVRRASVVRRTLVRRISGTQRISGLPGAQHPSRWGGRLARPRWSDDRGLTLTELLVTVVILSVIMVPLGNAVIGFIRVNDQTTGRLAESHDAQLAAAYFAQDVQSVGVHDWNYGFPYPLRPSVELAVPPSGGVYPCGLAGSPNTVIRLEWDDPDTVSGPPQVVRAAYVVVTVGTERQLHRVVCVGSATPVSDTVLGREIDTVAPVVTCTPSCGGPPVPTSITLTLVIRHPANAGTPLTVVLTGQRRQT